jgi:hypothetical protein
VVERVRERDVDRIDFVVCEQRFIGPVRVRDAVLSGVRIRTRFVAAPDRDDLDRIRLACAFEHGEVDPRGREDAPAGRGHG